MPKLDLNRKLGPLSTKTWLVVGAGTFGVVYYLKKRSESATATTAPADQTPSTDAGYYPLDNSFANAGTGFEPTTGLPAEPVDLAGAAELQTSLDALVAQLQAPQLEPTPVTVVGPVKTEGTRQERLHERIVALQGRRQTLASRIAAADTKAQRKQLRARKAGVTERILTLREKLNPGATTAPKPPPPPPAKTAAASVAAKTKVAAAAISEPSRRARVVAASNVKKETKIAAAPRPRREPTPAVLQTRKAPPPIVRRPAPRRAPIRRALARRR